MLQTLAYILVLILFILGTFILPNPDNNKSRSFSGIFPLVPATLLDLSPLILLSCVLRALHLRLSVLQPAVAPGRTKWVALGILLDWLLLVPMVVGQVLSVIDGTGTLATLQTPKKGKNMKGIGDVISAASFTLLVWFMYTLSGMAHNLLLLPDHVSTLLQIKHLPSLQPCTGTLYAQWTSRPYLWNTGILYHGQYRPPILVFLSAQDIQA